MSRADFEMSWRHGKSGPVLSIGDCEMIAATAIALRTPAFKYAAEAIVDCKNFVTPMVDYLPAAARRGAWSGAGKMFMQIFAAHEPLPEWSEA
jgi:hypothetical protein